MEVGSVSSRIEDLEKLSNCKKSIFVLLEISDSEYTKLEKLEDDKSSCSGPINAFMSWHIWIPLGRLSYSGYLIHIPVCIFSSNFNINNVM